jgi:hypothetical protein
VIDEGGHAASVDAWLERAGGAGLSSAALLQLFEAALGALWARTVTILGEITLTAIADRVLHDAAQKVPLFSSLRVEPNGTGIRFDELRESGSGIRTTDVLAGIRFVLVEFLTVLGNLTAGILTAELHAELSRVQPTSAVPATKGREVTPSTESTREGEGEG